MKKNVVFKLKFETDFEVDSFRKMPNRNSISSLRKNEWKFFN